MCIRDRFGTGKTDDYNDYINTKISGKNFKYGKLYDHCKACAVAIQEKFGGEIIRIPRMPFTELDGSPKTSTHFINKIQDHYFDVAGQQFGYKSVLVPEENIPSSGFITKDDFVTKDIRERNKKDRIRQFAVKANGETKPTAPVAVSENLEDVIAPELSVSEEKIDGTVTVDFADEKTGDFYDTRVGGLREVEIDSGQKLKSIKSCILN